MSNNPPTLTHLPATAAVDRQIGNMDAMDAINTYVWWAEGRVSVWFASLLTIFSFLRFEAVHSIS